MSVVPYPQVPTSTNGLAVDAQGRLVACERWNGALVRVAGGAADGAGGSGARGRPGRRRFAQRPERSDPARRRQHLLHRHQVGRAPRRARARLAVYRLAPDGALSVAFRVDMPNGVLLSPDGGTLYVGSDAQDRLWRLPVARRRHRRRSGAVRRQPPGPGRTAPRPRRPVHRRSWSRLRRQQQRRRQRHRGLRQRRPLRRPHRRSRRPRRTAPSAAPIAARST